ncbi:unnamed protein product [Lampetra planeri]
MPLPCVAPTEPAEATPSPPTASSLSNDVTESATSAAYSEHSVGTAVLTRAATELKPLRRSSPRSIHDTPDTRSPGPAEEGESLVLLGVMSLVERQWRIC